VIQIKKPNGNQKTRQILTRAKDLKKLTARQAINTALNLAEARLQMPVARSLPQNIDIVLTKACNLACTFCKDYETLGAKRVSVENFEKIAAQLFPTARWSVYVQEENLICIRGSKTCLGLPSATRYRRGSFRTVCCSRKTGCAQLSVKD
jgi:hypothetical protein